MNSVLFCLYSIDYKQFMCTLASFLIFNIFPPSRRLLPSLLMRFLLPLLLALCLQPLSAQNGWKLAWSDEFNAPAGTPPDPAKWTYDLGATGWGNQELQEYTRSSDNVFQDGQGNLLIRVLAKPAGGYTSARLKTTGLFTTTYGKIEARIRIPYSQGIWPAFWMLGEDIRTAGWPRCGEIDILENIGKEPLIVHGTVHGPGYSGGKGIGKPYQLAGGKRFADDFHVYSIIWKSDSIEWLVDGNSYHKFTTANLPEGTKWAFDHPFFILLNVAVGGNWPGSPDATTVLPQQMSVDYVRVYHESQ
jgi:beta-glucanase (GH16 family)